MSHSIIPQLLRKDYLITRRIILSFALVSLAGIATTALLFEHLPPWALVNMGLLLMLSPAATCGIVLLMTTVVFEKEKSTQSFIMSLPVSPKQYTIAKLAINLAVFGAFWLTIFAISWYFAFGRGLFPSGTIPFVVMLFLGVFLSYTGILSVGIWRQSLGITVLSIALLEMGTSGYLWAIAFFDPIARFMSGPDAVWNGAAVAIVSTQVLAITILVAATVFFQGRKRDFV